MNNLQVVQNLVVRIYLYWPSVYETSFEVIHKSQHRPIAIKMKAVSPQEVPFRRRYNLMKTDWEGFAKSAEMCITNPYTSGSLRGSTSPISPNTEYKSNNLTNL